MCRFVSLSDLDPKVVADYLVKLGCLEEVETITVTVDTNAESHVFQMETRRGRSLGCLLAQASPAARAAAAGTLKPRSTSRRCYF